MSHEPERLAASQLGAQLSLVAPFGDNRITYNSSVAHFTTLCVVCFLLTSLQLSMEEFAYSRFLIGSGLNGTFP